MKIYTKTGDNGTTSLWGGKRVRKTDKKIELLGSIDELVAWLGVLKLAKIQAVLMAINAGLAGYQRQDIESKIEDLETDIDRLDKKLPPLANFILPQNEIHVARAVCRRTERAAVKIKDTVVIKYLNRLSDYLFVLARYDDFKKGKKEIIWKSEDRKSDH